MYEHPINKSEIKIELLHSQIDAVGISGFRGIISRGQESWALFLSELPPAAKSAVDSVVASHDPTELTPEETAREAASAYAATLKSMWYPIVKTDPSQIQTSLQEVQTKLTEAQTALTGGNTALGIRRMLEAQVIIAQLGQTAMQHTMVLTRVVREIARRTASDILTDPEEL